MRCVPNPGDVGSPYAIGGPEGGHDAIHPQLGTLEDFRALVAAAKEQRTGNRARLRNPVLAGSSMAARAP